MEAGRWLHLEESMEPGGTWSCHLPLLTYNGLLELRRAFAKGGQPALCVGGCGHGDVRCQNAVPKCGAILQASCCWTWQPPRWQPWPTHCWSSSSMRGS